jgi:hypothetical protein
MKSHPRREQVLFMHNTAEVQQKLILKFNTTWREVVNSMYQPFNLREGAPSIYRTGCWVNSTTSLDEVVTRRILTHVGNQTLFIQSVVSHFAGSAILAHIYNPHK